jgi:phospholipase C
MLVISPYAKAGYISHYTYEFCSVLKFVEERWKLRHLTARDHWANDMRDCFDFAREPAASVLISVPTNLPQSQPILDYGVYPPSVPLPKFAPPRAQHMTPGKAVPPEK